MMYGLEHSLGKRMRNLVPRRFQWVDLQDRLSPTASGFRQPGVPIALKARKARSLEAGKGDLACEENSPSFRYVTLGSSGFYKDFFHLERSLDATLMPLTTNGAIAVGGSDQSCVGKKPLSRFPILGARATH